MVERLAINSAFESPVHRTVDARMAYEAGSNQNARKAGGRDVDDACFERNGTEALRSTIAVKWVDGIRHRSGAVL